MVHYILEKRWTRWLWSSVSKRLQCHSSIQTSVCTCFLSNIFQTILWIVYQGCRRDKRETFVQLQNTSTNHSSSQHIPTYPPLIQRFCQTLPTMPNLFVLVCWKRLEALRHRRRCSSLTSGTGITLFSLVFQWFSVQLRSQPWRTLSKISCASAEPTEHMMLSKCHQMSPSTASAGQQKGRNVRKGLPLPIVLRSPTKASSGLSSIASKASYDIVSQYASSFEFFECF